MSGHGRTRLSEFQRRWCIDILDKLKKKRIAEPFHKKLVPDQSQNQKYADLPDLLDLDMCRSKLQTEEYESVIQFGIDVRKVFSGNIQAHPPGHPIFQMACDLQEWFEKRFLQFPRSQHELWMMNLEKARKKVASLIKKAPPMDPPPYDYDPKPIDEVK
jgi:hypothetical protein